MGVSNQATLLVTDNWTRLIMQNLTLLTLHTLESQELRMQFFQSLSPVLFDLRFIKQTEMHLEMHNNLLDNGP